MSEYSTKYKCPECGAMIANRRYPKCESCAAQLPAELLYTEDQRREYDAEIKARLAKPYPQGGAAGGGVIGAAFDLLVDGESFGCGDE